ncbi:hypothetical protein [Arthrobacter sp. S41]|uniref:hypothetical protein n=1 Tax=Arthrobacter sp. S41 TaxID=2509721 RepID=UPI0013EF6574|nr:hypothetical protein [Arthrobacter sp. S41]
MDALSIILTIGAVIAGLIILWAVIALVFWLFFRRSFVRFNDRADERHEVFRRSNGFF